MATYTFQIISAAALSYNSGTGEFDVIASYDPDIHNLIVTVTDDDAVMNNNDGGDGTPVDTNQTAVITDMNGNVVSSGLVSSPFYAEVNDGSGGIFFDRIEIDGVHQGYATDAPISAGTSYPVIDSGATELNHDYFENDTAAEGTPAPCFGPGTRILTPDGPIAIEALSVGDLVTTRDHGDQMIRWIGRARVTSAEMEKHPGLHPIRIEHASPHSPVPDRPLILSGNHRVLAASAAVELLFATPEVLVAAKHFSGGVRPPLPKDVAAYGMPYSHILFDRHEVICADGLWVESLFDGAMGLTELPLILRRQLARITRAANIKPMKIARLCLTGREARALREAPLPTWKTVVRAA